MQIIKVVIPFNKLFPLSYFAPSNKKFFIGDLVRVPFRNKEVTGIVWEVEVSQQSFNLKTIIEKSNFQARISKKQIELIKSSSQYYLAELGTIVKLVLPVDPNDFPIISTNHKIPLEFNLSILSAEQNLALHLISQISKPTLIKGVTGSGKTEIYFHAIAEQLKLGNQVLIMLPEIALSNQIIDRFYQKFNFMPAIWNSNITKAQKKRIFRGIIEGQVLIVIGTRSSLFLPYKNLGIIVVDEEHDQSYKQNEGILYNARDMAVLRGSIEKCKVLLVSATPSIETIQNVNSNKYRLINLENRYKDAVMPDVKIIDMRQEKLPPNSWLSTKLINAITENLAKKKQTLLFLNRRGYAPLMLCKSCGYRFECYSCSSSMVVHKSSQRLKCHHCGDVRQMYKMCPNCKANNLSIYGPGIERIAEEVQLVFADSRVITISKDHANKPGEIQEILKKMAVGDINILIGTQIITKGYHFPYLTLVGVIDADIGFFGGDLRASEKMYQLLHQVGGRAGRESDKGIVMLQTYNPENKVLLAIQNRHEDNFINLEMESRKLARVPPFAKMASITLTGKDKDKTYSTASNITKSAPKSDARILGPAEALIFKLSGKYRYRILVLTDKKFNIQKYLKFWLSSTRILSSIHLKIDIDPYNFY